MDYKAAIVKGIREIQATSGSEEIRLEWEELVKIAEAEEDQAKLGLMYRSLEEEICKAMGVPTESFKVKTPSGIAVYRSIDQAIEKLSCK